MGGPDKQPPNNQHTLSCNKRALLATSLHFLGYITNVKEKENSPATLEQYGSSVTLANVAAGDAQSTLLAMSCASARARATSWGAWGNADDRDEANEEMRVRTMTTTEHAGFTATLPVTVVK